MKTCFSYYHTFGLTENYLLMIEQPWVANSLKLIASRVCFCSLFFILGHNQADVLQFKGWQIWHSSICFIPKMNLKFVLHLTKRDKNYVKLLLKNGTKEIVKRNEKLKSINFEWLFSR
jgi:carotenoid cleavage dioxygenase-like enzyme